MLRRLLLPPVLLLGLLAPALALAAPAEAAANRTPGCITRGEFDRLRQNMTPAQVQGIVGNGGRLEDRVEETFDYIAPGDGEGDYLYHEELDEYEYNGEDSGDYRKIYDEAGGYSFVYAGAETTTVTMLDIWQSYRKCRSFDGGRSRVLVNFDDYTQRGTGLRLFAKSRNLRIDRSAREALLEDKTPRAGSPVG